MDQIELRAATREVLGKKVRFLRRQGITPAHLFGHHIESMALQCDTGQLQHVVAQAGKTRLIGLRLDKARKSRNVVVREIQSDPLTGELLHVDFYEVSMAEKIKVEVPIFLVGEAPALKSKGSMLMQEMSKLTIGCLPDEIPPTIELDVSLLTEAKQTIQVKDITLGEGITVFDNPEDVVVKIGALAVEKVEVVVEEVVEAAEAAKAAPLPEEGKAKEE
jgi:large subunit ribosomal protein L25